MKKLTKLIVGLSVLAVLMVCMTAVSFAGTAEDKVTVSVQAGAPGAVDYYNTSLEVTGDLFEKAFPDLAGEDKVEGVSFADAIVAAHIDKYGAEDAANHMGFSNESWFQVTKQFDRTKCGIYLDCESLCNTVVPLYQVEDGDRLYIGSYNSDLWYDLYASLGFSSMGVDPETEVELFLAAYTQDANYNQVEVIPEVAEAKLVNIETGEVSDLSGFTYDPENGRLAGKIDKKGVYYLTATGTVSYDTSWAGKVTGEIMCPVVKVTVGDSIMVSFSAGAPGSFDYFNDTLYVNGYYAESYFPELAEYECEGVSFADAIVAAHIEKYGEANVKKYMDMSYNEAWATVSMNKQFGHDIVGFYYLNNAAIPVVAPLQKISEGDELFAGSYSDYNYSDLYSYFDKTSVKTTVGKTVTLKLNADNSGVAVKPTEAAVKTFDTETGEMKDLSGAKYADGTVTVKFNKVGEYYVSADGTVDYETSWGGATTGKYAGAYCKVVVNKASNTLTAKGKTVKASSKKKMTFTAKKAFTVKKNQGKVTYKKASGNSKISVSKAGKVTVKKGLKKGKTYSIKVKVTATGNANYKKGTKTATLKVKITK